MESRMEWEVVLAALYLRGLERPVDVRRSGWRAVENVLRASGSSLARASRALARAGLDAEALVLEAPGVAAGAEKLVQGGRALTCLSPGYPSRWVDVLGSGAPPALWIWGATPPAGPALAVVGSRRIGDDVRRFARNLGSEASARGLVVVSGGAAGCDRAAVRGAMPRAFEILPRGLRAGPVGPVTQLSVCAPDEGFSTASAMERNALVYAAADLAVVVHARFKEGGTWHGAVDAIRRRTTRLAVRWDPRNEASRALAGLGAIPLGHPSELGAALQKEAAQTGLFKT
ncbi:MAG: DNA-processing protein DprA [Fimbriimonadaceae bacterium]|nr:DNA-processing protein DprA [Fimbriimonadaceae bacterium]